MQIPTDWKSSFTGGDILGALRDLAGVASSAIHPFILDREKLGLTFEVFCTVKLSLPTKQNLETFEQAVMRWAEVVQCATVTGAADYELRIVTRDMHAFDTFMRDKLLSLGLVSNIESRIVIRSVKNSTAVPLGLVSPHITTAG